MRSADSSGSDVLSDDGLTVRQRLFVDAYLGVAALCPASAARIAGYSCRSRNALRVAGHRLLVNAKVQRAIRARLAQVGITREAVLERIAILASASLADVLSVSPGQDGKPVFRVDLLAAAQVGALGTIREYVERRDRQGKISRQVRLHDPYPYLHLLAKYAGLIGSRGELAADSTDGQPRVLSDQELIEYYQEQGWPLPEGVVAPSGTCRTDGATSDGQQPSRP